MKVILLMASTLDGKIARSSSEFPDWTGKEDKALFAEITRAAGVIIMGSNTYKTIGKALPGRLNIVMTRSPEAFKNQENLLFTKESPQEILQYLESKGFQEAVVCGGSQINTLFLKDNLLNELHLTFSPLIFGEGLEIFEAGSQAHLSLKSVEKRGENLVYAIFNFLK